MPRHDRAHGHYHAPGNKAGSKRRTRQRGKNTYATKQSRAVTMATVDAGRHDGASKPKGSPKPQKPKGTPKGNDE